VILLQAVPPLPAGTPWWAAVGVIVLGILASTITTIVVARLSRPKKHDADPLVPVRKTLAEHGGTLADHETRIVDAESVLSEGTDPDVRRRDGAAVRERIAKIEARQDEVERDARRRDEARHVADAQMGASLARIEGYLRGQEKR